MSDTLIGVIIGGVIGSFVPLFTLVLDHYRWKRQAKLEYLKSERSRLEKIFDETLDTLADAMKKDLYPSDMISDIFILMPKDVSERYTKFISDNDNDLNKKKLAYMDLAMAMKKVLADIDKEIKDLLS